MLIVGLKKCQTVSHHKSLICFVLLLQQSTLQSYDITPKGGNKPVSKNAEDYGMDQNSDDSTDDESAPRKPVPSWAEGLYELVQSSPRVQSLVM